MISRLRGLVWRMDRRDFDYLPNDVLVSCFNLYVERYLKKKEYLDLFNPSTSSFIALSASMEEMLGSYAVGSVESRRVIEEIRKRISKSQRILRDSVKGGKCLDLSKY